MKETNSVVEALASEHEGLCAFDHDHQAIAFCACETAKAFARAKSEVRMYGSTVPEMEADLTPQAKMMRGHADDMKEVGWLMLAVSILSDAQEVMTTTALVEQREELARIYVNRAKWIILEKVRPTLIDAALRFSAEI